MAHMKSKWLNSGRSISWYSELGSFWCSSLASCNRA